MWTILLTILTMKAVQKSGYPNDYEYLFDADWSVGKVLLGALENVGDGSDWHFTLNTKRSSSLQVRTSRLNLTKT